MKKIYKIIVQEHTSNGSIHMQTFHLDPDVLSEALSVRGAYSNADCMFILEYCLN